MKVALKLHVVTIVLQRLRVVIAQDLKATVQHVMIHEASEIIAMLEAVRHVVHVALHN